MIIVPGYQTNALVYKSANSLVYQAIRESDRQPVILKVLSQDYPSSAQVTRYRQEYRITSSLIGEGIIKAYSLEPYRNSFAICLEDFGGRSLKQLLPPGGFDLNQFFPIAIRATEILGDIHTQHVIHKDINPSNLVYNTDTGQLKIIDFGISTQLSRETPTLKSPDILEGTLAYISPEQTGRMNRSLDYRTDFYSLGATFYELLTGQLPFDTDDALELVHCHIAKKPRAPHEVNPAVPVVLSDLVLKLMAKTAEDRYQSALGIQSDLVVCLMEWEANAAIDPFILGENDVVNWFQLPQKLYGREREVAQLLSAFYRMAGLDEQTSAEATAQQSGEVRSTAPSPPPPLSSSLIPPSPHAEIMLIAGYSGIGKSALVKEIHKPITQARGYFIAGKFDQFQRTIPYSAIVSAFTDLVRQLLTENAAQLQHWRDQLCAALGGNGQVIIDVIPDVELIIGAQPTVPELAPTEAQNRFNRVFQNFIHVFCRPEHPLVLFLDDLQWADAATLKLIELMTTDGEGRSLLLIGAYRDNEVSPTHPLMTTLGELKQQGVAISAIALTPLTLQHINQLIAEALYSEPRQTLPLAQLVERKTGGNPFFINQFLEALHSEQLIRFDLERQCWQWDLGQIEAQNITDNVVELLIGKLRKLPLSTQQALSLAACLGAEFDLTTLSIICEQSPKDIFSDFTPALQSALIVALSDLDEDLLIHQYKFGHDRIQQAAYALINEAKKAATHLQIGRLLWQNTPTEALSESIFAIVDHLNLGVELIAEQTERDRLAHLNLVAGQKAKAAAAYAAAFKYLQMGVALLSADSWQTQYELTLSLHSQAAEAAYLSGDFAQMRQLVDLVLHKAHTVLDKVKAYDVTIQAASSQGNLKQAIKHGLEILDLLGVSLPEHPEPSDIHAGLGATAALYAREDIAALIHLPTMTAPEPLAAIYILSSMGAAAYTAAPNLMVLIVFAMVKLSIQHGHAVCSPFSYASYGFVLCGIVQDIEAGSQFGKLALELDKTLTDKQGQSKAFDVLGGHVIHWNDHLSNTLPIVTAGYHSGIETGDFEYAGYNAFHVCANSYWLGQELTDLEQKIATYSKAIHQIRRESALNWTATFWQTVLNLLGQSEQPTRLQGMAYSEDEALPRATQANERTELHFCYLNKLILSYLFGDRDQAIQNAALAEQYLDGAIGMIAAPIYCFYDALVQLERLADAEPAEHAAIHDRVAAHQAKLQNWAHYAPMNHQHKVDLVLAETARIAGDILEAEAAYERAIAGATEHGYIQEAALAYELAAKFYLARGRFKIAQTYMKDAHYAYSRWGAKAKVNHLETIYPQLLPKASALAHLIASQGTIANITTSGKSGELDLATIMKASQAIAGEIVLDQLLAKLIAILVENTGAQSGCLILNNQGELLIQAEATANGEVTVLQAMPLDGVKPDGTLPLLSAAIVNYVARTQTSVVLTDAMHEGNFTGQSYIQTHYVRSVLCVPLLNQGELSGLVYLENNLTTGAFTPARVEIVQLLSGQVAIAIANARLYAEMNEQKRQLTQYLEAMPVGVTVHNLSGQIYYANQTARQLLGIHGMSESTIDELAATYQAYQADTENLYPTEQMPIVQALQGNSAKADDMELHQPDRVVPLEVSATPILDETGKVVSAIAAFQDITGRKRAEAARQQFTQELFRLNQSFSRFVPRQFLQLLNRESIIDVQLGDQVQQTMSVLFSDIRHFTNLSESMTPEENFRFINAYLSRMEPAILENQGFIDKYIGDAIMALFTGGADKAVKAGIAMLQQLTKYNEHRRDSGYEPMQIGIGINTGSLILGTVGGENRMDTTVISDAVNLASRLEQLTKKYGVPLLISHHTFGSLQNPENYNVRFIDRLRVKGRSQSVAVFEVFDGDSLEDKGGKVATKSLFEEGLFHYSRRAFQDAAYCFQTCLKHYPADPVTQIYLERSNRALETIVTENHSYEPDFVSNL